MLWNNLISFQWNAFLTLMLTKAFAKQIPLLEIKFFRNLIIEIIGLFLMELRYSHSNNYITILTNWWRHLEISKVINFIDIKVLSFCHQIFLGLKSIMWTLNYEYIFSGNSIILEPNWGDILENIFFRLGALSTISNILRFFFTI